MPGAEPYASGMEVLLREVERAMPDTCRVTRQPPLPQTPLLDAEGNPVRPEPAVVYEGPCELAQPGLLGANQGTVNDQSGVPNMRVAKAPHRADLRPGDLFEVLTSAYSPGLVGDTFVVYGEDERSYATYRRYLLRGSSWLSPGSGTSAAPAS